jgi:mono/diheme cytochrome c family protein
LLERVFVLAIRKPTSHLTVRLATRFALGLAATASAGAGAAPTFGKEVAPILFGHCARCHSPNGIASNSQFLSYEKVRAWAKAIREKVLLREMPPWPADPNASLKFRNNARLSERDVDTLVAWVNAGAPKGNDADLPPLPNFAGGWTHPHGIEPDLVISLPGEFQAPARGEIPYLRYMAKVPLSEDRWIAACQARPGNAALVHHMAITEMTVDNGISPSQQDPFALLAREMGFRNDLGSARPAVTVPSNPEVFDMLGVYIPGTTLEMYTDDAGKLLRGGKNLYLNFNIHYQATGRPEVDRSMIAFWFRPGPPKHQLFRVPGAGQTVIANGNELLSDTPGIKAEGTNIAIPPIAPFADNYELIGVTGYTEPITVYQFDPHAHLRAKDFKYIAIFPDGREETLLSVPKYDFRWQLAYELETPLKLPAGSKLIVTAHYDNSRNNKFNPAPEKEVYFRDQNQSWDEMFTPFIQYSVDNQDLTKPGTVHSQERPQQDVLQIAQIVGCLARNPNGMWMVTDASEPIASITQSATSASVRAAESMPLGNRIYSLVGVGVFNPNRHEGRKVAVKGVLLNGSSESINVTSLRMLADTCVRE